MRILSSIAVILVGSGRSRIFRGCVAGRITRTERGRGGFGYDPVFAPAGKSVTFAGLSGATKNRISHRARALMRLKKYLVKAGSVGDERTGGQ